MRLCLVALSFAFLSLACSARPSSPPKASLDAARLKSYVERWRQGGPEDRIASNRQFLNAIGQYCAISFTKGMPASWVEQRLKSLKGLGVYFSGLKTSITSATVSGEMVYFCVIELGDGLPGGFVVVAPLHHQYAVSFVECEGEYEREGLMWPFDLRVLPAKKAVLPFYVLAGGWVGAPMPPRDFVAYTYDANSNTVTRQAELLGMKSLSAWISPDQDAFLVTWCAAQDKDYLYQCDEMRMRVFHFDGKSITQSGKDSIIQDQQ